MTPLMSHQNCRLANNPRTPLEVGDASGAGYRERGLTDGVGTFEFLHRHLDWPLP